VKWILRLAMLTLSAEIDIRPKTWPGDSTRYWRDQVDEYVRFYADALAGC
jgi:hypothetical protein